MAIFNTPTEGRAPAAIDGGGMDPGGLMLDGGAPGRMLWGPPGGRTLGGPANGAPGRTLCGPEEAVRMGAAGMRETDAGPGRGGSEGARGGAGIAAFMRDNVVAPGGMDGRGGSALGRGGSEFERCVGGADP